MSAIDINIRLRTSELVCALRILVYFVVARLYAHAQCILIYTGTKQEDLHHELFGCYMSDELMSDSISIFSDMNMSDSSGTFAFDPNADLSSSSANEVKKKGSQTSKKVGAASSKSSVKDSGPSVSIAQKLKLPEDFTQVIELSPTPDGNQLIVVTECHGEQEKSAAGAILAYTVTLEAKTLLLCPENLKIRNIQEESELPVASCFVPLEANQLALACVLRSGGVSIYSLAELAVISTITRSSFDPRITSVTYSSSE